MRGAALWAGLALAGCAGPPADSVEPAPEAAPPASVAAPSDPAARAQETAPVEYPDAPAWAFPALDDTTAVVTGADFTGRFVVVDFWASWCVPCLEEVPNLAAVRADYADRGLDVLSVSLDLFPDDVAAFRSRVAPMDWHHAFVGERFDHPSVQAFGVDRLPTAVLIGPDGTVRARGGHLRRDLLRITVDQQITAHEAARDAPR